MTTVFAFLTIVAAVACVGCLVAAGAFFSVARRWRFDRLSPQMQAKVRVVDALVGKEELERQAFMLALRWLAFASVPGAWLVAVLAWGLP